MWTSCFDAGAAGSGPEGPGVGGRPLGRFNSPRTRLGPRLLQRLKALGRHVWRKSLVVSDTRVTCGTVMFPLVSCSSPSAAPVFGFSGDLMKTHLGQLQVFSSASFFLQPGDLRFPSVLNQLFRLSCTTGLWRTHRSAGALTEFEEGGGGFCSSTSCVTGCFFSVSLREM